MNAPFTPRLSTHFTLAEATRSETAHRHNILNVPTAEVLGIMRKTALEMERIRDILGKPIQINSFYRCPELNRVLGSKPTSQHCQGEAVDFISPSFGTPLDICRTILANSGHILFDQLILEHSWVHISFPIRTGKGRRQVLSLLSSGKYALGLTDKTGVPYK